MLKAIRGAAIALCACASSQSSLPSAKAVAPTFSPPGGTYSSTQMVTISSSTPGAVIHCTQDGSTPSTASPTCATPVAVSRSITLNAMATAVGLDDSDIATATYTINVPEQTTLQKLQTIATMSWWFAHMSIGDQLEGLWSPTAFAQPFGLPKVLAENAGSGLTLTHTTNPATGTLASMDLWQLSPAGANYDPASKLAAFQGTINAAQGRANYAFFKFCFVDKPYLFADDSVQAAPNLSFGQYRAAITALELANPSITFLHVTVPYYGANGTDGGDNYRAHAWNELLRQTYGWKVWDLASAEATGSDGGVATALSNGEQVPCLNGEWAAPDGGHLNEAGTNMLANSFIDFLVSIVLH